jgi:hypothetical protein
MLTDDLVLRVPDGLIDGEVEGYRNLFILAGIKAFSCCSAMLVKLN